MLLRFLILLVLRLFRITHDAHQVVFIDLVEKIHILRISGAVNHDVVHMTAACGHGHKLQPPARTVVEIVHK